MSAGPWPRPMTEADRAFEHFEVMPEDPYERMMGIAKRCMEDRQKLKQENRQFQDELRALRLQVERLRLQAELRELRS